MRIQALLCTLVFFLLGCSQQQEAMVRTESVADSSSITNMVSLCGLHNEAMTNNLWGKVITIAGTYATDRQTYGWIYDECPTAQHNGIQFTRLVGSNSLGIELMNEAIRKHCFRKPLCVINANVIIRGTLRYAPEAEFGMLIEPIEIIQFYISH